MNVSQHNPHWDHLVATQQLERLSQELELWLTQYRDSLRAWLETLPDEWQQEGLPLLQELQTLELEPMMQDWPEARERLARLNADGQLLREDYLQQRGPTPLACLNSVILQLENLPASQEGGAPGSLGSSLLNDLKTLEGWAVENAMDGPAYRELREWLESTAMGLLSRLYPEPGQARSQLVRLWERARQEHVLQQEQKALQGPTRSPRWNSWILLLDSAEHETQDPRPVLDSLEGLDGDVEDLYRLMGDQAEVAEMVAEYRDLSDQLRDIIQQGKKLKGWSQILPPLLIELDALVPQDSTSEAPVSKVRSLCQDFEAGMLSPEQFHHSLTAFSQTLSEGRKRSQVQSPQHPAEASFVEALGKLEGGLDILAGVERASQASRLEMGCTLIEEGLAQLQRLETGDG